MGKRRWPVLAAGLAVAIGGCSNPRGVDGNLTNNWGDFGKPTVVAPKAGECYTQAYSDTWSGSLAAARVPCGANHQTEAVFVGTLPPASAPPVAGSPTRARAYAQCQTAADGYLGGDWHGGYVWLGLVVPSGQEWRGGARWFRCDAMAVDPDTYDLQPSTGSLRAALGGGNAGPGTAAITCQVVTDGGRQVIKNEAADCALAHNAEYAGVYTAPAGAFPSESAGTRIGGDGCGKVVAKYLGLPGGKVTNPYLGWFWTPFDKGQWALGDRAIQCFAVGFSAKGRASTVRFTGTLKGIKNGKPQGWKE